MRRTLLLAAFCILHSAFCLPSPAQCPPGVCRPPAGVARRKAARPKPKKVEWVVRVIGQRLGSNEEQWSSGIVVTSSAKRGTQVLVAAHGLRGVAEYGVIFADRRQLAATVERVDLGDDLAILHVPGRQVELVPVLAPACPAAGTVVGWAGWAGGELRTGGGRVLRYEGRWIVIEGVTPDGTSGGPIFDGSGLVGMIIETSQEVGRARGPGITAIRAFLDVVVTKQNPAPPASPNSSESAPRAGEAGGLPLDEALFPTSPFSLEDQEKPLREQAADRRRAGDAPASPAVDYGRIAGLERQIGALQETAARLGKQVQALQASKMTFQIVDQHGRVKRNPDGSLLEYKAGPNGTVPFQLIPIGDK